MRNTPRTEPHGARRFGAQTTVAVGALLALLTQLPACAGDDEDSPPEILNYVTAARLLDRDDAAVLHNEALPQGSADGPAITVDTEATIINGGSLQVPVESDAEFDEVLIGLSVPEGASSSVEAGSLSGYYEVALPAPTTSTTVVLTIARALPVTSVVVDVAAVSGGVQGPSVQQIASAVPVGSGEVQVSVSWDAESDVDLHVVDGNGDEIYYAATTAPSGGELDLDSNPACNIDGTNNENITFAEAPPGEYTVRVDYYDACGEEQTNYVVTVQLPGQAPQVFNGTFTGDGDQGGEGDGEEITTFTLTE